MNYSIVIPTYNRKQTLLLTLESVVRQTISAGDYEIIVVDDGSSDGTAFAVEEFIKEHPASFVRYFWQENGGPAKARNKGINESAGEYIFFTDDDCVVPENWMETLLDGFRRYPDVGGVGGWYKAGNNKLAGRYFQKYQDFLFRNNYGINADYVEISTNIFSVSPSGNTANMVYRRTIFDECGMFDENLSFAGNVDWELKKRVINGGFQLLYLPKYVLHYKEFGLRTFIKKCFDQGRGVYYMSIKYGGASDKHFILNPFVMLLEVITWAYRHPQFLFARALHLTVFLVAKQYMIFKKICPAKYLPKYINVEQSITRSSAVEPIIRVTKFNKFEQPKKTEVDIVYSYDFEVSSSVDKLYSVIMPTYDRMMLLARALGGLARQTVNPAKYEIIIVDDGSTDATRETVEKFKLAHPSLTIRYFFQENSGPAKARNRGIREAKGGIIFFTDDDCVVLDTWMEILLNAFKRYPETVGVGGWMMPPEGEIPKSNTSRYIYTNKYFPDSAYGYNARFLETLSNDPLMCFRVFAFNTANVCYKRKILEEVGGFREDFYWPGSEDNDLAFRIMLAGHFLLYLPFHVIHSRDMSFTDFAKLYFHRGANDYLFRKLNYEIINKLKPGFAEKYGMMSSTYLPWLSGPDRTLAFIEWVSINFGVLYMKRKFDEQKETRLIRPNSAVNHESRLS